MPLQFLNSPFGVFCLIMICVTSLVNIYAYWIEDGLLGRLLYMGVVLTSAAGIVGYYSGETPVTIAGTLIILFMLKSVRNVCVRTSRFYRYRRNTHAKKHQ